MKPQAALLVVLFLAIAAGNALADPPAVYGRIGGIGEGPQHTLKSGLEFGVGLDYDMSRTFALGFGFAHATDDRTGLDAACSSFELHARFRLGFAAVHPFVDLGAGVYSIHSDVPAIVQDSHTGPGVLTGLGLEVRPEGAWGVRAGATYHAFGSESSIPGGDLADYFVLGVTLEYRTGRK